MLIRSKISYIDWKLQVFSTLWLSTFRFFCVCSCLEKKFIFFAHFICYIVCVCVFSPRSDELRCKNGPKSITYHQYTKNAAQCCSIFNNNPLKMADERWIAIFTFYYICEWAKLSHNRFVIMHFMLFICIYLWLMIVFLVLSIWAFEHLSIQAKYGEMVNNKFTDTRRKHNQIDVHAQSHTGHKILFLPPDKM